MIAGRWQQLERGLAWLMAQQADDGGWHSQTYGAMKCGASLTSLVLYAAAHAPDDLRAKHQAQIKRGVEFLNKGIAERGFVVCSDGSLDFPEYGSALVAGASGKWGVGRGEKSTLVGKQQLASLRKFLLAEQRTEQNDFSPDNPDYGGWDLAGGSGLRGQSTGTNVSITCFVLEALQSTDDEAARHAKKRAIAWLAKVQNLPGDGGFFFHPERSADGNKALWADGDAREQPHSYGTATCDGIRALLYAGVPVDDARVKAALAWLAKHPSIDRVSGFEEAPEELGWQQGLRFYYYLALAKLIARLDSEPFKDAASAIQAQLAAEQHADGHWQNESARMREDDPVIATSFAVVALGELRRAGSRLP